MNLLFPPPAFSSAASSFGGRCLTISSACSISARSNCGVGSLPEELDILLLPRDRDRFALTAAQLRVVLARHLREHPLALGHEMELDQVAEELDEDDLAVGGIVGTGARAVGAELHRCGADRE